MINLLSSNILHLIVLLFVLMSCQNQNEKINEIKLTVNYIGEIEGGEVRLQKVSSAYSIELYKSENFNNNKIVFDISLLESTLFRLDILGKESIDLILGDGIKKIQPNEYITLNSQKKSLYAKNKIRKGS